MASIIKDMNIWEMRGVSAFLDKHAGFGFSVDDVVCGTSSNKLANLENTPVDNGAFEFDGTIYTHLGGFGITEGNDIVMEFWTEDGEDNIYVWIPGYRVAMEDNWIEEGFIWNLNESCTVGSPKAVEPKF